MSFRIGIGHDTHRMEPGRPLVIGGVTVPFEKGPVGHSDGDVLLHALVDAILGALGKGDIGDWFPDNDPKNKNRDSKEFLAEVLKSAMPTAAHIVNVDAIVFAERPKLGPVKSAIKANVAKLLELNEGCVNIKAKTGEQVGPIGCGEAIAAEVVVLIDLGRVDGTR